MCRYSIYWTQEESDAMEKMFSVCHIIIGQIMVSLALAAFAKGLTHSTREWYSAESAREQAASSRFTLSKGSSMTFQWSAPEGGVLEEGSDCAGGALVPVQSVLFGYLLNVVRTVQLFYSQQKVHLFLGLWLIFGVAWSKASVGWSLVEALHFSVTSLSTGGIWAIPEDSSDLQHFVVAVFTCTGAPIMCLSGGVFAHWLSTLGEAAHRRRTLRAAISLEELRLMNTLEIDDGDGFIDQTEYVILVLVRIRAIRPELIAAILARFRHLDADGLGAVPYEIFQWSNMRATLTASPTTSPTAAAAKEKSGGEVNDASSAGVEVDVGNDSIYPYSNNNMPGLIQID